MSIKDNLNEYAALRDKCSYRVPVFPFPGWETGLLYSHLELLDRRRALGGTLRLIPWFWMERPRYFAHFFGVERESIAVAAANTIRDASIRHS